MITDQLRATARSKVRPLEDLRDIVASLHERGLRVALSHGVFDLLHVGHIRHLERARALADVLIVTVSPDQYVNKGPHRPAFPQDLRAEGVAALGCVDYVAINRWPMAKETIEFLRPDFYVKGSDYSEAGKDVTGGITIEAAAIESVGGKIVFTNDIEFSSSSLINRHLSLFSDDVKDYLASFAKKYKADDVTRYLDQAREMRVLVVGEAIIDEYQYCEAIGKSSKEPTLAVRLTNNEQFAGGILAVANHVANFSDHVTMVAMVGADDSYDGFVAERLNPGIEKILFRREGSPTIVKRRFIDKYFFTKLLETYEMNDSGLEESDDALLCGLLGDRVRDFDAVIAVDFGHGMLSREAIDVLLSESRFLAANAQTNAGNLGYHAISKYGGADFISLTEGEMRFEARDRHRDLRSVVADVARRIKCGRVGVTLGRQGCLCYDRVEGFIAAPALATRVVDRVGAGDAFLSITALMVAQDSPMDMVAFVGNVVGAEAVGMVGNSRAIQRVSLYKHIDALLK